MTARWREARRTLFHIDGAASTDQAPPGNLLLQRPNLHRRLESCRSPTHPRPRGPPEAEENGDFAGGSTNHPLVAPITVAGEGSRKREKEHPRSKNFVFRLMLLPTAVLPVLSPRMVACRYLPCLFELISYGTVFFSQQNSISRFISRRNH
jgi:hypothetical protein